jgi:argininosuccinate lyase
MFSVDTLNEWVKKGIPFREAYQKMSEDIVSKNYKPKRDLDHTHMGSLGNLQLNAIRKKMDSIMD